MLPHVVENTADMLGGRRREDGAATPRGTYEARRAQQPQMMADQRGRGAHPPGEGADRHRLVETGQHDAQPRRIAGKMEGLCDLGGGIGRASCRGRVCQHSSISVVAVSLKKKDTSPLIILTRHPPPHLTVVQTTITSSDELTNY